MQQSSKLDRKLKDETSFKSVSLTIRDFAVKCDLVINYGLFRWYFNRENSLSRGNFARRIDNTRTGGPTRSASPLIASRYSVELSRPRSILTTERGCVCTPWLHVEKKNRVYCINNRRVNDTSRPRNPYAVMTIEIGPREKLNGLVQLIFISRLERKKHIGQSENQTGRKEGTYHAELFPNRLEVL